MRVADAGALEDEELGRVAELHLVLELLLELGEAALALLDQRYLVAHAKQAARDVRARLAAACDQRVHQRVAAGAEAGAGISQARTASIRVSIAVCVGETVRRPNAER